MALSPIESAVRARLKESMRLAPLSGEAIDRAVEEKTALVLSVLRETMADDATPSLDQIHLAELEATKRAMKSMIGLMTDPQGQAALNAAQKELNAAPSPPEIDLLADDVEARLAELEARLRTNG